MRIIKIHVSIYFELFFILVSTGTGCVSISTFASLDCVPVGITRSAVGMNICAVTAGIKNDKSIISKKTKHGKKVFLGKDKLYIIEVLISKALIDSCFSHDQIVSINNLLKEFNENLNKKFGNFCGIHQANMADISRKTYE